MARPPLPSRPVVTTLTCTYRRPQLLRIALDSLRRQTYPDLQIIVVNNGNPPDSETVQYLRAIKAEDSRVVAIDYAENQFSVDDPQKMLDCLNAAMHEVATGELVFILDDDNFIADDYVEKMVRLFTENPDCTTAAGLVAQVDGDGRLLPGTIEHARAHNQRARYTPGHLVVMDFFLGEAPTLWASSCFSFTIRRDEYIAAGGIQRGEHYASFFGIVPFGVTGFDDSALLYDRVHGQQLHRALIERGNNAAHFSVVALGKMRVEERWREHCGEAIAARIVTAVKRRALVNMGGHADHLLRHGRAEAALRQYRQCLVVDPDVADVHEAIGDACLVTGRTEEAARSYEEAIRLTDGAARFHARLAAAQYQQGRLAEAVVNLERAVTAAPTVAAYHRKLARLRLRQGAVGPALRGWIEAALVGAETLALSMHFRRARARRLVYYAATLARRAVGRIEMVLRRRRAS